MTDSIADDFRVLNSMEMGVIVVDRSLTIHYWNPWLEVHSGLGKAQVVGERLDQLFTEIKSNSLSRKIRSSLSLNAPIYYRASENGYLLRFPLGKISDPVFDCMQQNITIVPYDKSKKLVMLAISDETPLREVQHKLEIKVEEIEKLNAKLVTDPLTGLPTRPKLLEDVAESGLPILALISLESFREINDLFGHAVGDKVLTFLSETLIDHFSDRPYTLYKMPGDEFAILVHQGFDPDAILAEVKEAVSSFSALTYQCEAHSIPMSIASGIGCCKETLLRDADVALKSAKSNKTESCVMFDDSIDYISEYEKNLKCINELKGAINRDDLIPFLQAIVPLKDNLKNTIKFEALVRMLDDKGNVWSPFLFLEPAKKARLYQHITRTMIDKTLSMFAGTGYSCSINLSVEDIVNGKTVYFLADALDKYKMHSQTVLEITESEGIENFPEVSKFIQSMKKKGCSIAVDDFGSGYSNFEYLIRLDVDYIKIDGSIIKNIDKDKSCLMVAETIVEFSKKLGVKTIAEFVHSQEVLDIVKSIGVDYAQGFHLHEPSPHLPEKIPTAL